MWSADLVDSLKEICLLLEIKFTMPQRFLSHRSCYDVTLAHFRIWDAYIVFYHSFISNKSKALYQHLVVSIFHSTQVGEDSRARIREIQGELSRKSLTEVVESMFFKRKLTLTIMHFYSAVLAMLKEYVCLFELKQPMIHKLHDKQEQLFREFLECFVKPEAFADKTGKQLQEMDLDKAELLSTKSVFIGSSTQKALLDLDKAGAQDFLTKAQTAYKECAKYMQKKLPLRSTMLRRLSSIDPIASGHSLTLTYMKKLPETLPTVLEASELEAYQREVHAFQVDHDLPPALLPDRSPVQLDHWWTQVTKTGKYPALSKIAKAIMSCFHGPQVESSFNLMQDILGSRSGRMKIETFNAFQTVKCSVGAKKKTAAELFYREDVLHTLIDTRFCKNMQGAWKKYKEEKEEKNRQQAERREKYLLKESKLQNQQKAKAARQVIEREARVRFLQQKQKRKQKLEELVAAKKAKPS